MFVIRSGTKALGRVSKHRVVDDPRYIRKPVHHFELSTKFFYAQPFIRCRLFV